jgi:protein-disulfide isomerase-like protein with CxxC motif
MSKIDVLYFNDPGCPWGYSASPALAVLRWRYGAQLDWRLVLIGLAESSDKYVSLGYTPSRFAQGYTTYRDRYGMPFAVVPREGVAATAPACRAVIAARLLQPSREEAVFRALQFAWFTTPLVLERERDIAQALQVVPGIDVDAIIAALNTPEVTEAYQADRALARSAEGGATHFQGKSAASDGPVRYTAPSLIFTSTQDPQKSLEGGGFQTIEAYDVLIANLDRTLDREPPPDTPLGALERFPDGLVTQEIAAIMAHGNEPPNRVGAEHALIALAGEGQVRGTPLGDDVLWLAA